MNLVLQTVACDLCGGSAATLVTQTRDHEHDVPGVFNVVRCDGCGLHYLNPRPDPQSIAGCYPNDYYAYAAATLAPQRPTPKQRLKRLIRSSRLLSSGARHIAPLRHTAVDPDIADDLAEWVRPGKVLDVGCGAGAFLDGMALNGWAGFGIEPSATAAAAARAKGHTVACQSATDPIDATLTQHPFDVILMSHSLEHVHSPTRALANLGPLLKPASGHLIIEVPNVESLLTYWFGELGLAFDTPRHLYMFSPESLRKLIEKNGFDVRSIRHIARPVQFVRCLRLLAGASTPEPWRAAATASLDDSALVRALEPLAAYASNQGVGGAIRLVATRK